MRLKDKVAVITGAGQGIGKAVALGYAREGAAAVVADVDSDTGQETVKEIKDNGGKALFAAADVSKRGDVQNILDTSIKEFGQVDIWVNNAGIIRPAMLHKMTDEQWDKVIDVHLKGTFLGIQVAARHMMERNSCRIINVTSRAGTAGTIGQINYSAAKAGITGLTKSAARELARCGILVNCISPAATTRMTERIQTDPKFKDVYLARIPLGRWSDAEEMVGMFVYLASDECSYMTGQIIKMTGGSDM